MPARWKEVARLRFEGERFDTEDNALDLGALIEIARFHKLVVKAAESLWLRETPTGSAHRVAWDEKSECLFELLREKKVLSSVWRSRPRTRTWARRVRRP